MNILIIKIPWRVRVHETGLSGWKCSFFPTSNIYITLYFNVSSTLLRKNRNTDFLYIYIYICIFCCCSNLSISDDINFLGDRSENRCEKWHFWSEIASGFTEPCGTPPLRILRSTPLPPQDSCEDIPWTWITLFTLSKIWKICWREEEDWIFNTQKLADWKSNRQSLILDRHLCFLLSCFHKQMSAFMSIPPPLRAGNFSSVLSSSVKSLPLLLNQSPHAEKNLWYPG